MLPAGDPRGTPPCQREVLEEYAITGDRHGCHSARGLLSSAVFKAQTPYTSLQPEATGSFWLETTPARSRHIHAPVRTSSLFSDQRNRVTNKTQHSFTSHKRVHQTNQNHDSRDTGDPLLPSCLNSSHVHA